MVWIEREIDRGGEMEREQERGSGSPGQAEPDHGQQKATTRLRGRGEAARLMSLGPSRCSTGGLIRSTKEGLLGVSTRIAFSRDGSPAGCGGKFRLDWAGCLASGYWGLESRAEYEAGSRYTMHPGSKP